MTGDGDDSGSAAAPLRQVDRAAFQEKFGPVTGVLKRHPEWTEPLRRHLDRAGSDRSPEAFVVRVGTVALAAALATGIALAVAIAAGAWRVLPVPRSPVAVLATAVLAGLVGGGAYGLSPLARAQLRRRRIDAALPFTVLHMAALSRGELGILAVMQRVSTATDAYGDAARAFGTLVADVETSNVALPTALKDAQRRSPSPAFSAFLDDLTSVLESGGSVQRFLTNATARSLEQARQRQENYFQTLTVLAEAYIALAVAGPAFLTTTLVVIGLTGSETLGDIRLLTYVGIPAGAVLSILLVRLLSPLQDRRVRLAAPGEAPSPPDAGGEQFAAYRRAKRARNRRRLVRSPLRSFRRRPELSLLVTLPLAGLLFVFLSRSLLAGVTPVGVRLTSAVTLAAAVPCVGVAVGYELERRRKAAIRQRFPEVLETIASANANGLGFVDAVGVVARRSEGPLAAHLASLRRELAVTNDIERALVAFANEVDVPSVSRVTKLVIGGNRATSDLAGVLTVASDAVAERRRIENAHRDLMDQYVFILFVGVLVYLLVIVAVREVFFSVLTQFPEGATLTVLPGEAGGAPVPVAALETVLYHSVLIQAVGSGLLVGQLKANDLRSGLKYAVVLAAIVVATFLLV